MECVSESMTCTGEGGCGQEFAFVGPRHETYCAHLNTGASIKQLNNPWFMAGALIIPPAAPGWGNANIKEISNLYAKYEEQLPDIYKQVSETAEHLSEEEKEDVIVETLKVVESSNEVNSKTKRKSPKAIGEERAERFLSRMRK